MRCMSIRATVSTTVRINADNEALCMFICPHLRFDDTPECSLFGEFLTYEEGIGGQDRAERCEQCRMLKAEG